MGTSSGIFGPDLYSYFSPPHPIVAMVFVLRVTSAIGKVCRYGFNQ